MERKGSGRSDSKTGLFFSAPPKLGRLNAVQRQTLRSEPRWPNAMQRNEKTGKRFRDNFGEDDANHSNNKLHPSLVLRRHSTAASNSCRAPSAHTGLQAAVSRRWKRFCISSAEKPRSGG